MTRLRNSKGFGAIEALLIVLVLMLLGGAGWYVYSKSKDTANKDTNSEHQTAPNSSKNKSAVKPTGNWSSYSNKEVGYSFKHPSNWILATNLEQCSEGTVLLSPSASSLGKCASSSTGQVAIESGAGDMRNAYTDALAKPYYKDTTTADITVGGVSGTKTTTTVSGMDKEIFVGSHPDNTKVVQYVFFTNNRTYVATYTQEPSYPDALGDFNLIVTETLVFN